MKRNLSLSLSVVGITALTSCGDETFPDIENLPPIRIVETSLPDATIDVDYRATVTSTAGSGEQVSWQVIAGEDGSDALPPGLFATTGLPNLEISGRPRVEGTSTFTLRVTDSTGTSDTIELSLTVNPDPDAISIEATGLSDFPSEPEGRPDNTWIEGDTINASFSATGGAGAPYVYSTVNVSALPPGLNLSRDGQLTGTFQRRGTFSFGVQASDVNGAQAQANFVLRVERFTPELEIFLMCEEPEAGKVDDIYECDVCATGGIPPYEFALGQDGGVVPGIELFQPEEGGNCATLRGVPTETGSFAFRVTVVDSVRERDDVSLFPAIRPRDPPLRVTGRLNRLQPAPEEESFVFPQLEQGRDYEFEIFATGGTEEGYTWRVTDGTLPVGMALTEGTPAAVLAGAPLNRGIFSFELAVEDSDEDQVARRTFEVRVGAAIQPVMVTPPGGALPSIDCGVAALTSSVTVSAENGLPPYGWVVRGLPQGLTFEATANPVSFVGTATIAGVYDVDTTVYDSRNQTQAQSFTLEVVGPCP